MDIFSNLMMIGECLLDTRRTNAFKNAINNTVKPGDIVMDVGTGSGILAMLSAKAGAKKVFAVELAPDVAEFAKQNITANNLEKIIEVINDDATKIPLQEDLDVITMELMDTCLIAEHQALAINHLLKSNLIKEKTKLIPFRYQCALNLIEYDFNFYGVYMPFIIQARNFAVLDHIKNDLSKTIIFRDIDFHKPFDTNVDEIIEIPISKNGTANAILLKSRSFLSPKNIVWGTTDLNMPVVIPLKNEINVEAGRSIKCHLSYQMGEGYGKLKLDLD